MGAGEAGGEWLATVDMVVDEEVMERAELRIEEALDNRGLLLSGVSPNDREAVCV